MTSISTINIADAQSRLHELVDSLAPGQEVLITRDGKTVARLAAPTTLRDIRPASVGAIVRPLDGDDDDLLDEMLDR